METIKEAKEYLRENWVSGVDCPCCGQIVKCYKHRLNAGKVMSVIGMYKLSKRYPEREWFHVQKEFTKELDLNANSLHYSKMKYYGFLISSTKNEDPTKRASGHWCITQKGKDFVEKKIKVPEFFLVYNNKCIGFEGEHIDITQALENKFDYRELMGELVKDSGQTQETLF